MPSPNDSPHPDPQEMLRQIYVAGHSSLESELREARLEIEATGRAHERAKKKQAFIAEKVMKLYGSTLGNPGLLRALEAQPHDAALVELLKAAKGGWEKQERDGADDAEIFAKLKSGFSEHNYNTYTPTRAQGGSSPCVWIDAPGYDVKPTFAGSALVHEARRVLGIPKPQKGSGKKSTTGGTNSGGGKSKPAVKTKSAAKPAAAKPTTAPATSSSSAPTAKKLASGKHKPGPGFISTLAKLVNGTKKATAGKAKTSAAPSADPEWDPLLQGCGTYSALEAGFGAGVLEDAVPVCLRPHDGEGGVIELPLEDAVGGRWAVIGGSVRRDLSSYDLYPCVHVDEWTGIAETWTARRKRFAKMAPEDVPLGGVMVVDPAGEAWVLMDAKRSIAVTVPRSPASHLTPKEQAEIKADADPQSPQSKLPIAPPDAERHKPNARGIYVHADVIPIASSNATTLTIEVVLGEDGYWYGSYTAAILEMEPPIGEGEGPLAKSESFTRRSRCIVYYAGRLGIWLSTVLDGLAKTKGAAGAKADAIARAREAVEISIECVDEFRDAQRCRVCGCIENDCKYCIERTGKACEWIEEDLCSACVGLEPASAAKASAEEFPSSTARNRTIENLEPSLRPLMQDENVNEYGIYVRGVTEFDIGLRKPDKARIVVAQGKDGKFRASHDYSVHASTQSSAPSVKFEGFDSSAAAVCSTGKTMLHNLQVSATSTSNKTEKGKLTAAANMVRNFLETNPAAKVDSPAHADVDWVARMGACEKAEEARVLFGDHEDALFVLCRKIGVEYPSVGEGKRESPIGFSIVKKNEWKSLIAAAKKKDAVAAVELERWIEQGHAIHGAAWEKLLNAEHRAFMQEDEKEDDDFPDDQAVNPDSVESLISNPGRVGLLVGRRGNGRYTYSAQAYVGKLEMKAIEYTGSYPSNREAANAGIMRISDFLDGIVTTDRTGKSKEHILEINRALDKVEKDLVRDPVAVVAKAAHDAALAGGGSLDDALNAGVRALVDEADKDDADVSSYRDIIDIPDRLLIEIGRRKSGKWFFSGGATICKERLDRSGPNGSFDVPEEAIRAIADQIEAFAWAVINRKERSAEQRMHADQVLAAIGQVRTEHAVAMEPILPSSLRPGRRVRHIDDGESFGTVTSVASSGGKAASAIVAWDSKMGREHVVNTHAAFSPVVVTHGRRSGKPFKLPGIESPIAVGRRAEPYTLTELGLKLIDVANIQCEVHPPEPKGKGKEQAPGQFPLDSLIHINGRPYWCFGESFGPATGGGSCDCLHLRPLYTLEEWGDRPRHFGRNPECAGAVGVDANGTAYVVAPDGEDIEVVISASPAAPAKKTKPNGAAPGTKARPAHLPAPSTDHVLQM